MRYSIVWPIFVAREVLAAYDDALSFWMNAISGTTGTTAESMRLGTAGAGAAADPIPILPAPPRRHPGGQSISLRAICNNHSRVVIVGGGAAGLEAH